MIGITLSNFKITAKLGLSWYCSVAIASERIGLATIANQRTVGLMIEPAARPSSRVLLAVNLDSVGWTA
jgi:hypothetical protein